MTDKQERPRDLAPDMTNKCLHCGCGYNPHCMYCRDALYEARREGSIDNAVE